MIVKKTVGSIIQSSTVHIAEKGLLDIFIPKTTVSNRWKTWKATIDFKTCTDCLNNHGKVYRMNEYIPQEPPLHPFCRCVIEAMKAVEHGEATRDGENGADYILFAQGKLPDYYITRAEAIALGWKSSKPLAKYAPGKMLFGGIYFLYPHFFQDCLHVLSTRTVQRRIDDTRSIFLRDFRQGKGFYRL